MKLKDMLSPESIRLDQHIRDKAQLIGILAADCAAKLGIAPQLIAHNLSARETLGSTGLGDGIAVPHARLPGLAQPFAYAIRLRKAIDFEAVDDLPVDIVIGLLLPQGRDAENLVSLATITRRLRDKAVTSRIRGAPSAAAVYQALMDDAD